MALTACVRERGEEWRGSNGREREQVRETFGLFRGNLRVSSAPPPSQQKNKLGRPQSKYSRRRKKIRISTGNHRPQRRMCIY